MSVTDKLKWRRVEVMDSQGAVINPAKHEDLYDEGEAKTITAILKELRDYMREVVEKHATGLDETVDQSIELDTKGHKLLEVYAKATTATDFKLDVSPDNSTWIEGYLVWSSTTEVKETLWNGFRYVRLRSAAAGSAGDTVDLFLSAK